MRRDSRRAPPASPDEGAASAPLPLLVPCPSRQPEPSSRPPPPSFRPTQQAPGRLHKWQQPLCAQYGSGNERMGCPERRACRNQQWMGCGGRARAKIRRPAHVGEAGEGIDDHRQTGGKKEEAQRNSPHCSCDNGRGAIENRKNKFLPLVSRGAIEGAVNR